MSAHCSVLCSQLCVVWLCRDRQVLSLLSLFFLPSGEGSVLSEAMYTGMTSPRETSLLLDD